MCGSFSRINSLVCVCIFMNFGKDVFLHSIHFCYYRKYNQHAGATSFWNVCGETF
jgi:hypothetical protein